VRPHSSTSAGPAYDQAVDSAGNDAQRAFLIRRRDELQV